MTLVLEYMDGGSMADLLARVGRIAEFYLADIARQVDLQPPCSSFPLAFVLCSLQAHVLRITCQHRSEYNPG